jgi:hypothetical protein
MAMINIDIHGMPELLRNMDKIGAKLTTSVMRKALRAGSREYIAEAKKNASTMIGGSVSRRGKHKIGNMARLISKSLAVRVAKKRKRGVISINALFKDTGGMIYKSKKGKRSFIPAAIEYGHRGPGGKGGQVAKPIPFMRRAFSTKKYEMRDNIVRYLHKEIFKLTKKGKTIEYGNE